MTNDHTPYSDCVHAFQKGWCAYKPETPLRNPYNYAREHSQWIAYKAGWEASECYDLDY